MPKYRVYGLMMCSKYLGEFEADNQDQAQEMAENSEENHVSLCHQCSRDLDISDYSFQQFEVEEVR